MSGCSTSTDGRPLTISSDTLSTRRSVTYSSTTDCSVNAPPRSVAAHHERAAAKRLDRFHERAAADPRAQLGDQLGDSHRVAFDGQHPQHVLFEKRAPFDLLGEQTSDATKHAGAVSLGQERADIAPEHLANTLADHLQRQTMPP
jgi:hypothetical protein